MPHYMHCIRFDFTFFSKWFLFFLGAIVDLKLVKFGEV